MYCKRLLAVLTVLFTLFVLSGCGGGGESGDGNRRGSSSLSLNAVDDFPPFTWLGITEVDYLVTKEFLKESEVQSVVNWFTSKYQGTFSYTPLSRFYSVSNPRSNLPKVKEINLMVQENDGYYYCLLGVVADPSVTLDENLLEVLFGPTNVSIVSIRVAKSLSGSVDAYLQEYANLLSKSPYNFTGSNLNYIKGDILASIHYSWIGGPSLAIWRIELSFSEEE
ncbi:MAG: hypothetical protein LBT96_05305 [Campylobacteraceae bacterium]|jgi:hypothetical protein|nr:hypothetical protein [Campylobacteraceae bacterium]